MGNRNKFPAYEIKQNKKKNTANLNAELEGGVAAKFVSLFNDSEVSLIYF